MCTRPYQSKRWIVNGKAIPNDRRAESSRQARGE
jgi:hypothetical protein